MKSSLSRLVMALAMFIFGTSGVASRFIELPSASKALLRGAAGSLFLFVVAALMGTPFSWKRIRPNLRFLLIAGAGLGVNWILFFEGIRHTSVAVATVCYYLAPVVILCAAPFVLGEKLSHRSVISVLVSLLGLICVAFGGGDGMAAGGNHLLGVVCELGGAVTYAVVVLSNKFVRDIKPLECTGTQLGIAAVVLAPYVLVNGGIAFEGLSGPGVLSLCILCLVHTGLAYIMYFSSLPYLTSQTTAALSYVDPLTAILLSALLFGEQMTPVQMLGAVLILGGTFRSSSDKS